MSPKTDGAAGPLPERIHIGSRVRIAVEATLVAALRGPTAYRPAPGQMAWAGGTARVTGYRRTPDEERPLFELKDVPGLWAEEWLTAL